MLTTLAQAAPLMEEGFPYPAGAGLTGNAQWSGTTGSAISVVSGNLTLSNLAPTVPAGNMVQISGGTSQTVYRNFSSNAVTGGSVYFSALLRCTQLPTNTQFIASLMAADNTSLNSDTDPLDLSATAVANGYRLSVISAGSDRATVPQTLVTNTTHFIVLRYDFTTDGQGTIYLDPTPGGNEPISNGFTTSGGDGGAGASNLQLVLFHTTSSGRGIFELDSLRVGTNWADVASPPAPLSLNGPSDQAVCAGSAATFSVLATGTPPYIYQWRINGLAVANATSNLFTLNSPGAGDTLKSYDVVVSDAFGSITSRVAGLTISINPPGILVPPVNQLVLPGTTVATFNVQATGDAPLSYQWRTNGVAIPGETNTSYSINNPGPADVTNAIDVLISNPCGTITSEPPVGIQFQNQFCIAADGGQGFFSGEGLILTNSSGLSLYCWSSPDPTISVTNWTLEGSMIEQVISGTTNSTYGITVTPVTSPAYYIIAQANTGPFTATEPLIYLTTADYVAFNVGTTNIPIGADGIFIFPGPPSISQQPQSQAVMVGQYTSFTVAAAGAAPLSYQWLFNNKSINGATAPVLSFARVAAGNAGAYTVVVTDASGSMTSGTATLTVLMPPTLKASAGTSGTIVWTGNTLSNLVYVVQSSTSLSAPNWVPVLTNTTASDGAISFQTSTTLGASMFYRLYFPSLAVVLPPTLKLTPGASNGVQLSANTLSNLTYIVEITANLTTPNWLPVITNYTGINGAVNFQTNVPAGTESLFYRLVFP